jgi:hypothetical protein
VTDEQMFLFHVHAALRAATREHYLCKIVVGSSMLRLMTRKVGEHEFVPVMLWGIALFVDESIDPWSWLALNVQDEVVVHG